MEIWFSTKQRQDDKHTIDPGNQGSMLATVFGQWRKIRHSADSLTSLQAFSKKMQKRGVNGINQRRSGTGWAQALVKR